MFRKIEITKESPVNCDSLLRDLIDFGYTHTDRVGEYGDFSFRGEVIDIYPLSYNEPVRLALFADKIESIYTYSLAEGAKREELEKVTILPHPEINVNRVRRLEFGFDDTSPVDTFFDVEPGDYVVHVNHGIGRYVGMRKIDPATDGDCPATGGVKKEEGKKDYLVIEYKDDDLLYVPADNLRVVRKYVGAEGLAPKLYKLGTKDWERAKQKTYRAVTDLAAELIRFQAARSSLTGFSYSPDTDWQTEIEAAFPYEETPDQLVSSLQVKMDMESSRPMDRLICGDVGYGKTEVALRAAFKAVMNNKQVALLVPTTILAQQHCDTFRQRMESYPVNIQMLSRFKSRGEQKEIVGGLQEGRVDIVIGTHRLFSSDVKFKDLGLVIIDEEQRFGVRHKERLKHLRTLVDVLTLTATPIPRTLYLSLMGAKDISVVNTPPKKRIPIKTSIERFNASVIKKAIERELARGGQVYFVHNRVESIDAMARYIARLLPRARIGIGHGRMEKRQLQQTMADFVNKRTDILVATTIIESGLDIPNVNTIIINRADRFGLSDLYQLRGRVGRAREQAFAYLLLPGDKILAEDVRRRIEAIEKFTQLGAGFKIAMKDLELRGAGNILGVEQSGYVQMVGFDLYCKMLKGVIESGKRKGDERNEEF